VQGGLQPLGQFTGLDVVAAKAFDPATGDFADMEEVSSGGYNLVKNGIGVPVGTA
jgi:hypothetical protein